MGRGCITVRQGNEPVEYCLGSFRAIQFRSFSCEWDEIFDLYCSTDDLPIMETKVNESLEHGQGSRMHLTLIITFSL